MPKNGHILALDVGPGTTAIYGRRQVLPSNVDRTQPDVYESNVTRLIHAFYRPTERYDSLLKRTVPGPMMPIIAPVEGTFDTGILLYVVAWWMENVVDPGVVLAANGYRVGIRNKGRVRDRVSQFFRHVANLDALAYTPDTRLKIEQRDYLRMAIGAWLQSPRGIWRVATSGGKTYVLGALAGALPQKRFLITVPHTRSSLAVQGVEHFHKMGHRNVGLVKASRLSNSRIVWAAISTLVRRYEEDPRRTIRWMNRFDVLAKDECHEHSEREDALYQECSIWARLGMSGTVLREEPLHDARTIGTMGPVLYTIRNIDLKRRGVIKAPHVYVLPIEHEEQQFSSYPAFHRYVATNIERNRLIVRTAKLLRDLGHRVVVSTSSVSLHARILVQMLSALGTVGLYSSKSTPTPEERKNMLIRLARRDLDFVVASRIFEVGVSENSISAIIFAGPMGKGTVNISVLQKAGRGLRLGEGSARHVVIVDIQDHTQFGTGQARRRMEVWREDNAFDLHVAHTEYALHQLLENHHGLWSRETDDRPPESSLTVSSDSALRGPPGHRHPQQT